MPINNIQFQHGTSLPDSLGRFGSEEQCIQALFACRWPSGFTCPRFAGGEFYRPQTAGRPLFHCRACGHQASLTAGTLMEASKLPLHTLFLAIYLISQAKTSISSLALKRHLGVDYCTACLMHHKLLHAMGQADAQCALDSDVLLDDAYLGGEKPGALGRGSTIKVPIVAAVSLNEAGHPAYVKVTAVSAFRSEATRNWAKANLAPECGVRSDGLACFAGVIDAGCAHSYTVVGQKKPRELPQFTWINTVLGDLRTKINGAHKHFNFAKYANRYLSSSACRFHRGFDLSKLVDRMLRAVVGTTPLTEVAVRCGAEVYH